VNSIATISSAQGGAATTGAPARGRHSAERGRHLATLVRRIAGAAAADEGEGDSSPELRGRRSQPEREQEQRRNAAARRKLEARRELQLLRRQLTEPWDEIGSP
jgi:hypothetical protein